MASPFVRRALELQSGRIEREMTAAQSLAATERAKAAWMKIADLNLRREEQPTPNNKLFHYTTADGVLGIIGKNEIWATSAYYLNDSAEITYGYGVLKEALQTWIASRPITDESLAVGTARDLLRGFGEDLLNKNLISPIYLACFCEEDNLLSQWRAYGQAGGYSLGFDVLSTGDAYGFKPDDHAYTSIWLKVVYKRNEQLKICHDFLDSILSIVGETETSDAIGVLHADKVFSYYGFYNLISEVLMEEVVAFKNEAFEVEREWRIAVRPRNLRRQHIILPNAPAPSPHCRSMRGMVVPYVKLVPPKSDSKFPLCSVRSGPTMDKTTAGMAISLLTQNTKYAGVRVLGSDITVRF